MLKFQIQANTKTATAALCGKTGLQFANCISGGQKYSINYYFVCGEGIN
jgi:hypothetical protein